MKVLVINCGSSSLKYQLIDMNKEFVLAKGLVERIGIEGSILIQKVNGKEKYVIKIPIETHKTAIKLVLEALVDETHGVISTLSEIIAVGHRVVHAGEFYSKSVVIDEKVMENLTLCIKLAPLHNAANLVGISACKELMPITPMVAVFDTAFHQTMPEEAYIYALPYELYTEHAIRRYGFHGTSHKYVSDRAAKILKKDIKDLKIITCHLGNGSSITAIKEGKSIETSMGFTPLEGIAMGSRSGSIDPAIVTYIIKELNMSQGEVDDLLNKKSGVLGISGVSSDFRDIRIDAEAGNSRSLLALKIFTSKIKQFIGSYVALMGGLDCLVFTAGVGENSEPTRAEICGGLDYLGIIIDKEKNKVMGKEAVISADGAKVKVIVIPTDEELMIARDTKALIA
ncbi:MAG TPA: acetate kinase [Clostridium sp.]